MDTDLEYALRTVGYAAASHVMARASMSGRTGRYEETLSADLTDLMRTYGAAADGYLADVGAAAAMAVRVWDVHKAAEANIGADFVIVFRGAYRDPTPRMVRKLVLVQAKRQDWGKPRYASSTNHVAKAQAMLAARGSLSDCFFAYYHDPTALSAASFPTTHWPAPRGGHSTPPKLFFTFASDGPSPYLAPHPRLGYSTFIERSGYRQAAAAANGHAHVPSTWSWGVGVAGANYFITPSGRRRRPSLPPLSTVASRAKPLDEWLVSLADCSVGTAVASDAELNRLLARALAMSVDDQPCAPSCIVEIAAVAGIPRDAQVDALPLWAPDAQGLGLVDGRERAAP